MARPRKPANAGLPPYVYVKNSAFILRRPGEGTVRLCSRHAPRSEVWRRYEEHQAATGNRRTVRALVTDYMRSERYRRLSSQTRALYEIGYSKLFAFPLRVDGALTALGDLYADEVTRGVVRLFLDGYPSPKAANRYRAALSAAYAWASERDMVKDNPCRGVSRNPEAPRERYITDAEFEAVLAVAPRTLRAAMEIAYLTVCRVSEVLDMRVSQVGTEGVTVARGKGSLPNLMKWTPRLRAAVDAARGPVPSLTHVLASDRGQRITYSALRSAFVRAMERAGQSGWTIHDIKAKGYSDHANGHLAAGHRSDMRRVYDRKIRTSEPTR